jgi:hypothetical protein
VGVENKDELTERMFEYCIQELRYRAEHYASSPNGAIQVYPGAVYKSDSAIPPSLKHALQGAVRPLEDVPEHQKDWHPGSHGQVLDLVHPSLFPLVYGESNILRVGAPATTLEGCVQLCGKGKRAQRQITPPPDEPYPWASSDKRLSMYSSAFQWLPCEVDISGEKPRYSSAFTQTSRGTYSDQLSCDV